MINIEQLKIQLREKYIAQNEDKLWIGSREIYDAGFDDCVKLLTPLLVAANHIVEKHEYCPIIEESLLEINSVGKSYEPGVREQG